MDTKHQDETASFSRCESIVGVTLLEVAVDSGNVVAVQQLLQAQPGPNINHQDEFFGKYSYPNISNYLKSIFFLIYIQVWTHLCVNPRCPFPQSPYFWWSDLN